MHLNTEFMKNATGEKMLLWEKGQTPLFEEKFEQLEPSLYPYLLEGKKDIGAIIVCPGGGYSGKAAHEAEPIAMRFNELGFHAFVLDYRVAPYKYPAPLYDVNRAVKFVRYNAEKFGVDPKKIYTHGFSAGGHLASMSVTHYDKGIADSLDPIERVSSRPDAGILCYGVNSFMFHTHMGSCNNLLGENAAMTQRAFLSSEYNVNADTPPIFMWHTSEDRAVPVKNSLDLANALAANGIPFALHVYPYGVHGIGLANEGTRYNEQARFWPEEAARFLNDLK